MSSSGVFSQPSLDSAFIRVPASSNLGGGLLGILSLFPDLPAMCLRVVIGSYLFLSVEMMESNIS